MRIAGIETIRVDEHPNLLYVRILADDGASGLGETFFGARTVEAYIHETVAPAILGRAIEPVEEFGDGLTGYLGFASSGAETRGNSAIDMAVWDLVARSQGVPLHQLLSDHSHVDLPVYNTCAGPNYVQQRPEVASTNWGLEHDGTADPYEDLEAFLYRADELAQSLIEQGFGGMKIWPFDTAAEASAGQYISRSDLKAGLVPIEKIRRAVGNQIDVMIELHGLWNVPMAQKIAGALEEFEPRWIEDPVRLHDFDAVGRVARATRIPIAAGETLGGSTTHERMMERGEISVAIVDVAWAGGVTEARRVARFAEARGLEIAYHDCTGPVGLAVATHLALASPTARVQEVVRAFYHGWYRSMTVELSPLLDGRIGAGGRPGHGVDLVTDLTSRPGVSVRSSRWAP